MMKYTIALSQWRLFQLSLQSNILLLYKGILYTTKEYLKYIYLKYIYLNIYLKSLSLVCILRMQTRLNDFEL